RWHIVAFASLSAALRRESQPRSDLKPDQYNRPHQSRSERYFGHEDIFPSVAFGVPPEFPQRAELAAGGPNYRTFCVPGGFFNGYCGLLWAAYRPAWLIPLRVARRTRTYNSILDIFYTCHRVVSNHIRQ
ncbi:MAG: hypothetical protein OXK82_01155, partial [Deltaproteobacteria bacterium]|nr:hypothetical protein [Deltaproteobacteria bacterium]